jgi:hypothetical protein
MHAAVAAYRAATGGRRAAAAPPAQGPDTRPTTDMTVGDAPTDLGALPEAPVERQIEAASVFVLVGPGLGVPTAIRDYLVAKYAPLSTEELGRLLEAHHAGESEPPAEEVPFLRALLALRLGGQPGQVVPGRDSDLAMARMAQHKPVDEGTGGEGGRGPAGDDGGAGGAGSAGGDGAGGLADEARREHAIAYWARHAAGPLILTAAAADQSQVEVPSTTLASGQQLLVRAVSFRSREISTDAGVRLLVDATFTLSLDGGPDFQHEERLFAAGGQMGWIESIDQTPLAQFLRVEADGFATVLPGQVRLGPCVLNILGGMNVSNRSDDQGRVFHRVYFDFQPWEVPANKSLVDADGASHPLPQTHEGQPVGAAIRMPLVLLGPADASSGGPAPEGAPTPAS